MWIKGKNKEKVDKYKKSHLLQRCQKGFKRHSSTKQGFGSRRHWGLLCYSLPLLGRRRWRGFRHRLAKQERDRTNKSGKERIYKVYIQDQ